MIVERYSQNAKLGGMGATYRKVGFSCPQSCPLLGNGCYAERGRVALHAHRAEDRDDSFNELCGLDMVRWMVSGDVFTRNRIDRSLVNRINGFHLDNPRTHGALYTHRAESWTRAGFTPEVIADNLSVLASVDSPGARRKAKALGWRTARVIAGPEDRNRAEMLCPYDLARHQGAKPNPHTCRLCRACWPGRKHDIAFIKFGGMKP